ncbi:unnamed protein product [Kluyveromyces dobzhanskii CBS 2104]|uniref:WGS project CCBQ000000000 data, contig 00099 n=1 Tax=Kluyveromyces dobzhanskii CBS 2104 TaxID=1427455 RepID=A0A0A8L4G4_9SACH|nr:unnamed protein product [Kluyveromyces dobzhanskii CBS 2104]
MSSNPLQIIDISQPEQATATKLLDAAREQGFLFVDGHDFTQEEVDLLFELSNRFFTTTPHEEKLKYFFDAVNNFGYTDFSSEQLDLTKGRDFKECYNFGSINFSNGTFNTPNPEAKVSSPEQNETPELLKNQSDLIVSILHKYHRVATEILRLITIALEIEDHSFFTAKMKPNQKNGCVMRFLRYPLIRDDDLQGDSTLDPTIRAGAHTDYGALALLMQRNGQQGLELQIDKTSEEWVKVPFVPPKYQGKAPPLVVNFGDMLSYWTNGVLRSTNHRVKFSPGETRTSDRYSIVFFVHPDANTTLDAVPSKIVEDASDGNTNPTLTALQYLQKRLKETYEWQQS